MADISQINLPGGSLYNVKDAVARSTKADKVAPPADYDSTSTYAEGDFVTYNGNIYICIYPITTAEAWNAYHWQLCTPQQDYLHSLDPAGDGSFSLNRKSGTTIGACSFAEGYNNTASDRYSHAEGYNTTASNRGAHAEGWTSIASGNYSHAEGLDTAASGYNGSHAEGSHTIARGNSSHAEGSYTLADGNSSHAEGSGTTATRKSQHTFGEYNVLDASPGASSDRGKYIEIVGNGTADNARSNARTLDWSGNEVLAGGLKINGTQNVATQVSLTQAEYDALVQAGTVDFVNTVYFITDGNANANSASETTYDNASSGLSATNVQGAIDEIIPTSGSNANGTWIKFPNGTMICTKEATKTIPSNGWQTWGGCYDTKDVYDFGSFAETFYSKPVVTATITAGNGWLEFFYDSSTSAVGKCRFIRPTDPGAAKDFTVSIIAIGRWKA